MEVEEKRPRASRKLKLEEKILLAIFYKDGGDCAFRVSRTQAQSIFELVGRKDRIDPYSIFVYEDGHISDDPSSLEGCKGMFLVNEELRTIAILEED